jgi:hypothetical protein
MFRRLFKLVKLAGLSFFIPISYFKLRRMTLSEGLFSNLKKKGAFAFVRIGDGEIAILLGEKTVYEDSSFMKAMKMLHILMDSDDAIVFGLPLERMKFSFTRSFFVFWAYSYVMIPLLVNTKGPYYSSFIFREGGDLTANIAALVDFINGFDDVFYLTSNKLNYNNLKKRVTVDIQYVEVEKTFSAYKFCKDLNSHKSLILVSFGTSGKFLAYDMCRQHSMKVIDIGAINFSGV